MTPKISHPPLCDLESIANGKRSTEPARLQAEKQIFAQFLAQKEKDTYFNNLIAAKDPSLWNARKMSHPKYGQMMLRAFQFNENPKVDDAVKTRENYMKLSLLLSELTEKIIEEHQELPPSLLQSIFKKTESFEEMNFFVDILKNPSKIKKTYSPHLKRALNSALLLGLEKNIETVLKNAPTIRELESLTKTPLAFLAQKELIRRFQDSSLPKNSTKEVTYKDVSTFLKQIPDRLQHVYTFEEISLANFRQALNSLSLYELAHETRTGYEELAQDELERRLNNLPNDSVFLNLHRIHHSSTHEALASLQQLFKDAGQAISPSAWKEIHDFEEFELILDALENKYPPLNQIDTFNKLASLLLRIPLDEKLSNLLSTLSLTQLIKLGKSSPFLSQKAEQELLARAQEECPYFDPFELHSFFATACDRINQQLERLDMYLPVSLIHKIRTFTEIRVLLNLFVHLDTPLHLSRALLDVLSIMPEFLQLTALTITTSKLSVVDLMTMASDTCCNTQVSLAAEQEVLKRFAKDTGSGLHQFIQKNHPEPLSYNQFCLLLKRFQKTLLDANTNIPAHKRNFIFNSYENFEDLQAIFLLLTDSKCSKKITAKQLLQGISPFLAVKELENNIENVLANHLDLNELYFVLNSYTGTLQDLAAKEILRRFASSEMHDLIKKISPKECKRITTKPYTIEKVQQLSSLLEPLYQKLAQHCPENYRELFFVKITQVKTFETIKHFADLMSSEKKAKAPHKLDPISSLDSLALATSCGCIEQVTNFFLTAEKGTDSKLSGVAHDFFGLLLNLVSPEEGAELINILHSKGATSYFQYLLNPPDELTANFHKGFQTAMEEQFSTAVFNYLESELTKQNACDHLLPGAPSIFFTETNKNFIPVGSIQKTMQLLTVWINGLKEDQSPLYNFFKNIGLSQKQIHNLDSSSFSSAIRFLTHFIQCESKALKKFLEMNQLIDKTYIPNETIPTLFFIRDSILDKKTFPQTLITKLTTPQKCSIEELEILFTDILTTKFLRYLQHLVARKHPEDQLVTSLLATQKNDDLSIKEKTAYCLDLLKNMTTAISDEDRLLLINTLQGNFNVDQAFTVQIDLFARPQHEHPYVRAFFAKAGLAWKDELTPIENHHLISETLTHYVIHLVNQSDETYNKNLPDYKQLKSSFSLDILEGLAFLIQSPETEEILFQTLRSDVEKCFNWAQKNNLCSLSTDSPLYKESMYWDPHLSYYDNKIRQKKIFTLLQKKLLPQLEKAGLSHYIPLTKKAFSQESLKILDFIFLKLRYHTFIEKAKELQIDHLVTFAKKIENLPLKQRVISTLDEIQKLILACGEEDLTRSSLESNPPPFHNIKTLLSLLITPLHDL